MMLRPDNPRAPWRLLLTGAILALLSACSQAPAPKTVAEAAGDEPTAAEPATESASAETTVPTEEEELIRRFGVGVEGGTERRKAMEREVNQPPDENWLKDEAGREYYLKSLPKDAERWYYADDAKTKVRYGYDFYELEEEREQELVVRVFKPVAPLNIKLKDEARFAALRETFQHELVSDDRLRFKSFGSGLPDQGQWRNGFDIADMDGDGFLDVVHGPPRKMGGLGPIIFLGDGAGNWRPWREAKFPQGLYSYGDVAVDDFNRDGIQDVVFGLHIQGVLATVGDGKGGFVPWSRGIDIQFPGRGDDASGFSSRAVTTTDWNGDQLPDILAFGEGPRPLSDNRGRQMGLAESASYGTAIFINGGDGTWQRLDQGLESDQIFGDAIEVAHLDDDGRPDFVTSSSTYGVREVVNLGGAAGASWEAVKVDSIRPGSYVRSITTDDFDGDGRRDLALSYLTKVDSGWWTGIDLIFNRGGDGWQRRTITADESKNSYFALGAGDLDGDGERDLVALTRDGETRVFLGAGGGEMVEELSPEIADAPGKCRGYRVMLRDLDGDGRDEFVEAFAGEPSGFSDPDRCPSRGLMRAWDWDPSL
ncbi:MAG: VCBS repeat-containing protein [Acidobacteriota bacterium]